MWVRWESRIIMVVKPTRGHKVNNTKETQSLCCGAVCVTGGRWAWGWWVALISRGVRCSGIDPPVRNRPEDTRCAQGPSDSHPLLLVTQVSKFRVEGLKWAVICTLTDSHISCSAWLCWLNQHYIKMDWNRLPLSRIKLLNCLQTVQYLNSFSVQVLFLDLFTLTQLYKIRISVGFLYWKTILLNYSAFVYVVQNMTSFLESLLMLPVCFSPCFP